MKQFLKKEINNQLLRIKTVHGFFFSTANELCAIWRVMRTARHGTYSKSWHGPAPPPTKRWYLVSALKF
jgi:hypothetical protein